MTVESANSAAMDAKVLLTGATGYIGSRLLRQFEEGGRAVRCLVRQPDKIGATGATTEVVRGDCLDEDSLDRALADVESAYYLVHSMGGGPDFADVDRRAATTFGRAAARAGVQRIVYLGGLADETGPLSAHLKSRAETGTVLRASGVPVVEFRASIVIGAGSLSFEMIQALVERLPVMVCPRWVATLTQPIAIDDLLDYLEAALDLPEGLSGIFEISGPEVVSYGDMMREYARLRGLRRLLLPVPVLTPHLSGLWLALVTPSQAHVGRALVEGLKNATVVHSTATRDTFRIEPMPLRAAFLKAIDDGSAARQKVDSRTIVVDVPPAQAFAPVRRIGGAEGWYSSTLLWQVRGWIDRSLGGVGMGRGRSDQDACAVGDAIDGWTVEAYEPDRLLRIARRAPEAESRSRVGGFAYRSVIGARAADVFQWHERPEALLDLIPPHRWIRVESRTGGLHDGGRVTFSFGVGPLRVRWEARHYGYMRGTQFCDEQIRGPFKTWRHTHRIEPIGTDRSLYEDRIEYAVPGGALAQRIAHPVLSRLLLRLFALRHQIVRASFPDSRVNGT